jgi:hypothetical protein
MSKSPMHEVEGEEQVKVEQFQAWSEGTVTNWIIHLLKIPRNTKHLWAGEQKTVTAYRGIAANGKAYSNHINNWKVKGTCNQTFT